MFHTLHVMFEEQHTDLTMAIDEIAERIQAVGQPAPGSFSAIAKLAKVGEEIESPSAGEMTSNLIADQATRVQTCKDIFPIVQRSADEPTAGLLIRRMQIHAKTARMLRSLMA